MNERERAVKNESGDDTSRKTTQDKEPPAHFQRSSDGPWPTRCSQVAGADTHWVLTHSVQAPSSTSIPSQHRGNQSTAIQRGSCHVGALTQTTNASQHPTLSTMLHCLSSTKEALIYNRTSLKRETYDCTDNMTYTFLQWLCDMGGTQPSHTPCPGLSWLECSHTRETGEGGTEPSLHKESLCVCVFLWHLPSSAVSPVMVRTRFYLFL